MPEQVGMEGLIDHLENILKTRFSSQVSEIYFGDIGVYNPTSFSGTRSEQRAVIALSPSYNRLVSDQRNASFENRNLGVDIIIMINMTPFFEARPSEAFGERKLVRLTTEVATFLTQEEHVTLGDRVQMTTVGDIDWLWQQRQNQALRAAGIAYDARVRITRT